MTYRRRLSMIFALDTYLVLLSVVIGYQFFEDSYHFYDSGALLLTAVSMLISHHVCAFMFHQYKQVWTYTGIGELLALMKGITLSAAVTAAVQYGVFHTILFRLLAVSWMVQLLFIGGSRMISRVLKETIGRKQNDSSRALIIGAGAGGTLLVRQLTQKNDLGIMPVAFIDDDQTKHKLEIMGLPVIGGKESIMPAVQRLRIHHIIIAIPSLCTHELQTLYKECVQTGAHIKIMPQFDEILLGTQAAGHIRDVKAEDLLGRKPVTLDTSKISDSIKGKTILVTGAGGSIGSEICRQISAFLPREIVLLGHGENSIHSVHTELSARFGKEVLFHAEIADIQDRDKIFTLMKKYEPHVVYHAAAHKHVPLMEHNPEEAVKNNIIGTKNVAEAADMCGTETFVLISSDKAVNPANVMGATKRFAEMVIMNLGKISRTKFAAVRFGNVLGSRGSVIPIFKKQIEKGGPVTVTHPAMTRYFMTIPEASRLVIQAGALAKGRQIFVLDMGEPVKIVDLAKNLIHLSGYTTEQIPIEFSGIRPGEKMYEELLNHNEVHTEQIFPKIHIGKAIDGDWAVLIRFMEEFSRLPEDELRKRLFEAIESVHEEAAAGV
ncbi:nucleoside-diphosphate sugar epimerase/dehydratase [Bacillus velezensis]|uniref:polysaccharide biosynthesis protein n=1 Tax=Bacillus velezensis TaxID=492670 RepID=UPI002DBF085A|nr:nucleoside-diphosphate sugar epimerase/dehydratase [Bacillus velezensis]MEC0381927.1 nucleoside-diphosphate sugar epimerase/dehydratase [Bacillus velezensis]